MKRFTGLAVAALGTVGFLTTAQTVTAGPRELSYAAEDAAFQAVMQMTTDSRVKVKRIAFVKLMRGNAKIPEGNEFATVFENGLVQAPSEFEFLTHQDQAAEWTEVDRFFDAATDFGDYDPATLPKTGVFKMAEAFIIGRVIDATDGAGKASVRVSLRLISIETAERLWAGTVEGIYDDPGPDNEMVSRNTRMAMEKAAEDAASQVLSRLAGYRILVLPLEGPLGRAMTQNFLRCLSKEQSIRVLDLPNGSVRDRMMARFLRERVGTNRQVSNSLLKRINQDIGGERGSASDKVAVLSGAVSVLDASPVTVVDPVGDRIGAVTGSATAIKANAIRTEVVFDAKFRDINDSFAIVAAASGRGIYKPDVLQENVVDQLLALVTLRNIVLLLIVFVVCWFASRLIFRVR
ncbi:MAG: hypothetical protein WCK89_02675 [bacterium]